jgi:hypothetical protein
MKSAFAVVLFLAACSSSGSTVPGADASGGNQQRDAAMGAPSPDTGMSAPAPDAGMAGTGVTLDQCFAGLRPLQGSAQIATRASADGKYRMRLALETADRGGTSGSYGWAAIRVGITGPEGNVCIDEADLAKAYVGSHHNCADVLTVTADGRRYVVSNPDTTVSYADKTKWDRLAHLTVFSGATMTAGPIELPTVACDKGGSDGLCRSGGPCN